MFANKFISIVAIVAIALIPFISTSPTPVLNAKLASPAAVAPDAATTTDWNNTPEPFFCAPEVRPQQTLIYFLFITVVANATSQCQPIYDVCKGDGKPE